ncbi:hypothetical protein ACOSQ2_025710 [Xanthoceras sorbifolium]
MLNPRGGKKELPIRVANTAVKASSFILNFTYSRFLVLRAHHRFLLSLLILETGFQAMGTSLLYRAQTLVLEILFLWKLISMKTSFQVRFRILRTHQLEFLSLLTSETGYQARFMNLLCWTPMMMLKILFLIKVNVRKKKKRMLVHLVKAEAVTKWVLARAFAQMGLLRRSPYARFLILGTHPLSFLSLLMSKIGRQAMFMSLLSIERIERKEIRISQNNMCSVKSFKERLEGRTLQSNGMSPYTKESSFNDGGSMSKPIKDFPKKSERTERNGNPKENRFVATRKKECATTGNEDSKERPEEILSECTKEKDGVRRKSDVIGVTDKWRCPQKSKPNRGPPLKQLQLERWIHKI